MYVCMYVCKYLCTSIMYNVSLYVINYGRICACMSYVTALSSFIRNVKNQFSWPDAGRSRGPTLQICSFLAAALQWQRSCWYSIPHHGCYFLFLDPFCLLKSSPECLCRQVQQVEKQNANLKSKRIFFLLMLT